MSDNPTPMNSAGNVRPTKKAVHAINVMRLADECLSKEISLQRDNFKALLFYIAALEAAPVATLNGAQAEAHKQIYAAVQATLESCLPGMKEPTRQAAAVSLALKLRELFAKCVA